MSKRRNLNVMGTLGLGLGLCLGAGLMYYLDPDRGRRRRALVVDQAVHLKRETGRFVNRKTRHLGNRAKGIVAEAKGAVGLNRRPDYTSRTTDSRTLPAGSNNHVAASVVNGHGGDDEQ